MRTGRPWTGVRRVAKLTEFLVDSIEQARAVEKPFYHLQFDRVFPDDIYAAMLREMPVARDYRALPGRNNVNILDDGSATRVKIDLFPEYIRNMPAAEARAVGRGRPRALLERGAGRLRAPARARRWSAASARTTATSACSRSRS